MNLIQAISKQLQRDGEMRFVDFMQQALYHPQFGYYTTGRKKLGSDGDFITAPELTPLFAQALAQEFKPILKAVDKPSVLEFGAGSGRFCVDVLQALEALDALPEQYCILELSDDLQKRQQALIVANIPHLASRVEWLSAWPKTPLQGVFFANEVLDAMPVHRFIQTGDGVQESFIGLNDEGQLYEFFKPCTDDRLIHHVKKVLPANLHPYQSEANLFIDEWLKGCANVMRRGAFFIIDYGFPEHEFYHPERRFGTLMCHQRHKTHPNALAHPGEQDITAHVDFTHVANAADEAGFHIAGFASQASFLLANGFLDLLATIDERLRTNASQAAKQLLQAHEMGELFKVLALTKELPFSLKGFQLQDRRASL